MSCCFGEKGKQHILVSISIFYLHFIYSQSMKYWYICDMMKTVTVSPFLLRRNMYTNPPKDYIYIYMFFIWYHITTWYKRGFICVLYSDDIYVHSQNTEIVFFFCFHDWRSHLKKAPVVATKLKWYICVWHTYT